MKRLQIVFVFLVIANVGWSQVQVITKEQQEFKREYRDVTGILGAFDEEIRFLLTIVTDKKDVFIQRVKFTEGKIDNRKVVVAQTGIGKVNAAIVTTLMIENFQPSEIIFTGIAGGTNPELSPGDLVIGKRVAYHDYGTITPDSMKHRATRNPFTMAENPIYYKSDEKLVTLAVDASQKLKLETIKSSTGVRLPKMIVGTIVTGDVFVASDKAVKDLRKMLGADATEMEGAAVAQVCLQQVQPFVVIRSLSDNAGNTASNEVQNFYQLAARNSAHLVIGMVQQLSSK